MLPFTNPYSSLPRSKTRVVAVDISAEDYYCVKNIRPEQGTMSGVAGTLWQKLCNELRKRNIGDFTQRHFFEHFVSGCQIVDGECASGYTIIPNDELEQLRVDSANWQQWLVVKEAQRRHGP